jgi:hypothetical protein
MTYLDRKLRGACTRCGVSLTDDADTNLCEPHRLDLNARVRAHAARKRDATRRMLAVSRSTAA